MKTGREIKNELARTMLMLEEDEEYLTAVEFAAMYGYRPSSIRQMLKRDQIAGAVKVGNEWRISEDAAILVRQSAKKRGAKT